MKKLILLAFGLIFSCQICLGEDRSIGLILGSQNGLSGKYDFKRDGHIESIQADIASGYSTFDYMRKDRHSFRRDFLKWYYGPGVVIKKSLGIRAATALEYNIEEYPIHVVGKLSFAFVDGTELGVGLGVRYDF